MKETIEKNNSEIIDVIDEFDYSTQQESYNKHFIAWRKNKNNPYAYNFVLNKKESVFIDGEGFVGRSAEEAESETLSRILYIIGIAMLSVVLIENVFDKLFVQILDAFGVNIHGTFFNSVIYGGRTEVVVILIIVTLMKLIVPMGIIHSRFRMPLRLRFPMSLSDPRELFGAIAASMIVSVVSGIPSAYSDESKEIYAFFKTYDADISVWGQEEFLIYTIFDVIVVSILFELLYRGEMFHALRQFGDVFAVIFTSVISGIVTQDYRIMASTMLISAVSSIGALRGGTVFTAIAVRVVYKMYMLALMIIEMNTSENMFLTRNFFMICVFITGLLVYGLVLLSMKRREKKTFADCNCQLSLKKKLFLPFKILPLSAVIVVCLLAAAIYLIL